MKLLSTVCIIVAVITLASAVMGDGVIKVDPNAPTAAAAKAEPVAENDPRLDQEVTYNGGYKRLHTVTDELSQMTGVVIYSGLSSRNWQVRDIPMVVCVKDLPLGKLLRAIADAALLRLSSRRIEDQGKVTWTYRLSRSVKEEMEIDTLLEKKHDSELAVSIWAWDALKKCGQQPERKNVDTNTMLLSRLIASLGDDSKEKLLAYDTLSFKASDPRYRAILHELYTMQWHSCSQIQIQQGKTPEQSTEAEIDAASLTIKLVDTALVCNLTPITVKTSDGGINGHGWCSDLNEDAQKLGDVENLGLPPVPKEADLPGVEEDMTYPNMSVLGNDESWSRPTLNKPFNIQKPEDKTPVFADILQDLHKATGISIVCEDFKSHMKDDAQPWVPAQYRDGNTLRQALKTTSYKWFINDKDALLVGWSGGNWRNNHRNLVPEEYLLSLRKKLDSVGVTIDDAAGLAALTEGQFNNWIFSSRDLSILGYARPCSDVAIWKLYSHLKPEDKALAKTGDGLPLATLDPQWIREAFLEQKRLSTNRMATTDSEVATRLEQAMRRDELMTDPQQVSTMVMRLSKTTVTDRLTTTMTDGREGITFAPIPEGLSLNGYMLEITYGENGQDRMAFQGPTLPFPVYSAKREAEILRENNKQAGKSSHLRL